MSKKLLSAKSIAEMMDLSDSAVRKLAKTDPKFPKAIRFGGNVRWWATDVATYIRELVSREK